MVKLFPLHFEELAPRTSRMPYRSRDIIETIGHGVLFVKNFWDIKEVVNAMAELECG